MKLTKGIIKWAIAILAIPVLYIIVSLSFSAITIDRKIENHVRNNNIYLSTNGVHLDIVIPITNIDGLELSGLKHKPSDNYLSFGWGDEKFYLNTPTWGDLTFSNAFRALFLKSPTLMHVTRYKSARSDWVEIEISDRELNKLKAYIFNTFIKNENGTKILLENQGYSSMDDFYKAKGNFTCFKTCNTWVNSGFKESGLKSCLWTPFDFGLLNKYK